MNEEYWKFAESERHFNELQAGIRNLASGWMLAAFGAIALLLKSDANVSWLVSHYVLIGVVSLMATLGLLILWINDQMVYQRLLDCCFVVALKMEYDDPRLPPLRAVMISSTSGKGMSWWMANFYIIPMWVFLAITATAGLMSHGAESQSSLWILTGLGIVQLVAVLWVQYEKRHVGAKPRSCVFGDEGFKSLFGSEQGHVRIAEMIARHRPAGAPEEPKDMTADVI